jgi:hypothetical protein
MNQTIALLLALTVFGSSCSHSKPSEVKKDSTLEPEYTPRPGEPPLELPKSMGMTMNEYLNNVALPKITDSKIVNKCFLDTKHANAKERASGHLSFQFEIKLLKRDQEVIVTQAIIASSENLPEWTKPCIIRNYKTLIFPTFPDPLVNSTSAFGSMDMSWKP